MNEHRRSRLKRLALGTALVGSSMALAQGTEPPDTNAPPRRSPRADAGTPPLAPLPVDPGPPPRVNSPGTPAPLPDAGVLTPTKAIKTNSPPKKHFPMPKTNSPGGR